MDVQPAPDCVLELLASKICTLPACVCLVNGLKCTDMCRLEDCNNQPDDTDQDAHIETDKDD
jgi:hypothetical protein